MHPIFLPACLAQKHSTIRWWAASPLIIYGEIIGCTYGTLKLKARSMFSLMPTPTLSDLFLLEEQPYVSPLLHNTPGFNLLDHAENTFSLTILLGIAEFLTTRTSYRIFI